ncbi:glycine oxidase ThiO [Tersicoccus sp. Bi-70]|uniref:glycine oxidase ThiO n=1 Tax=Tersicoccus sp. Bi-70 TaxID=1897634 RepID=UPI0009785170|nr:glycine oxidase ThiO [Tersicoccus sp. Bi-70]OMH37215.1 glycine oxidase ThiO [Tersicoccus sp. Bi-70]
MSGNQSGDVLVLGAGVVGLGIAFTLARAGHPVTVVDPAPASGATHAAAGMIAPVAELAHQEEALLPLTLDSARRYRGFVDDVAAVSGRDAGYATTPTLVCGFDAADRDALAALYRVQLRLGLDVEQLTTREARRREPLLGPHLTAAYLLPHDHQVDPRVLSRALLAALEALGVRVIAQRAEALLSTPAGSGTSGSSGGRVAGARLADGSTVEADETIVATGVAADLPGLPAPLPLRPVHGDVLRLRPPAGFPALTHTVRAIVRGVPVYVVPRFDGTLVLGATAREDGGSGLQAGGVHTLLRDGITLLPALAEATITDAVARARPGTPDNMPLLGRMRDADGAAVAGLVLATGFFRHGVLLTPLAGAAVRGLLVGDPLPVAEPCDPDRFALIPRATAP